MTRVVRAFTVAVCLAVAVVPAAAAAQSATNLAALRGLAPFAALLDTPPGHAALAQNYVVTGAIQTGAAKQPGLQPFAQQRQQALRDAVITGPNAFELADGLGSRLGDGYHALATFTSGDDGAHTTFTNVAPSVGALIAFTAALTAADAASAKFFFANETTNSKPDAPPLSADARSVFSAAGGMTDVYGKAYGHAAASSGADEYGDSRPFQTETGFEPYAGMDFFGVASGNLAYLDGPTQDLRESPSFPSGHTTYGYTESLLLALMVPERYSQMIARGAEYGNGRIVLGAHYAMDVIAGRALALYDVAHLLAEDPAYVATMRGGFGGSGYRAALAAAAADLADGLAMKCGAAIAICASGDGSRFGKPPANEAFYESTQTYGLPVTNQTTAHAVEDVASLAPEAAYLLTVAFPRLTLAQAAAILTETEGPGGGFLDNGSAFGLFSRLDLYRASEKAAALAPGV